MAHPRSLLLLQLLLLLLLRVCTAPCCGRRNGSYMPVRRRPPSFCSKLLVVRLGGFHQLALGGLFAGDGVTLNLHVGKWVVVLVSALVV